MSDRATSNTALQTEIQDFGDDALRRRTAAFPFVLVVIGTRPEAIKMAPVIRQLAALPGVKCQVCVTAQHREIMDSVLHLFGIAPDYDLDIMREGNDLCDVASGVMLGLRDVFKVARPNLVVVHGDTTTCMAATLAAFYHRIPIAHVEAGLRTFDLEAPFPEEANRLLVGRLAALHFAPTRIARDNLLQEGVASDRVWVTGNTVIDALKMMLAQFSAYPASRWQTVFGSDVYQRLTDDKRKLIVVTGHRRENIGEGLRNMCAAVRALATTHLDWDFVFPIHPNSAVKRVVWPSLAGLANVVLAPPLDYLSFVWLMSESDLILTDSGGIQEEGPALGKPVLVMRSTTERPEAIDAGTALLVGTDCEMISAGVERILGDEATYSRMVQAEVSYGDGSAAARIAGVLAQYLNETRAADRTQHQASVPGS